MINYEVDDNCLSESGGTVIQKHETTMMRRVKQHHYVGKSSHDYRIFLSPI